ncbi:hypothetical protein M427DRAFT_422060 [Gonapodya prolifera JEL478]|uniref:Helicase ATP-binding domain-containing protein n=1 Tax=Gonapodya prolifera (strain JEL478) TaxID=1344416 RepID=A0A139A4P0_GONPJ|nr:hypothetical protein M427DRAFT_422060 [Gonapodya prolifera JEL478]|eukprot:KXS11740.1 hypothetical protein M427DRAFT_422060 [Gonapodya prolifera JEL478]
MLLDPAVIVDEDSLDNGVESDALNEEGTSPHRLVALWAPLVTNRSAPTIAFSKMDSSLLGSWDNIISIPTDLWSIYESDTSRSIFDPSNLQTALRQRRWRGTGRGRPATSSAVRRKNSEVIVSAELRRDAKLSSRDPKRPALLDHGTYGKRYMGEDGDDILELISNPEHEDSLEGADVEDNLDIGEDEDSEVEITLREQMEWMESQNRKKQKRTALPGSTPSGDVDMIDPESADESDVDDLNDRPPPQIAFSVAARAKFLSREEISEVIDEALKEIDDDFYRDTWPWIQEGAHKIWSTQRRSKERVAGELTYLQEKRMPELQEQLLLMHWVSRMELKRRCGVLERSQMRIRFLGEVIKILEGPEPQKCETVSGVNKPSSRSVDKPHEENERESWSDFLADDDCDWGRVVDGELKAFRRRDRKAQCRGQLRAELGFSEEDGEPPNVVSQNPDERTVPRAEHTDVVTDTSAPESDTVGETERVPQVTSAPNSVVENKNGPKSHGVVENARDRQERAGENLSSDDVGARSQRKMDRGVTELLRKYFDNTSGLSDLMRAALERMRLGLQDNGTTIVECLDRYTEYIIEEHPSDFSDLDGNIRFTSDFVEEFIHKSLAQLESFHDDHESKTNKRLRRSEPGTDEESKDGGSSASARKRRKISPDSLVDELDDDTPISISSRETDLDTDYESVDDSVDENESIPNVIRDNKGKAVKRNATAEGNVIALQRKELEYMESQKLAALQQPQSGTNHVSINLGHDANQDGILVPPGLAIFLLEHQIKGIRFMWKNLIAFRNGCILAHAMGLGKTLQVITFVATLLLEVKKRNAILPEELLNGRILITVPAGLVDNWAVEVKVWLQKIGPGWDDDIKIYIYDGLTERKLEEWFEGGGILLISNTKLSKGSSLPEMERHFVNPGPALVVVDEAHFVSAMFSQVPVR